MKHALFPIAIACIVLEILAYTFLRKKRYPWSEMMATVAVFVMRIPERLLHAIVILPIAYLAWSHRIATIPLSTWWGLAVLFVGSELAYYWSHRADHRVRWMWATHAVHHTPERIHLASAFRLGATGILSGAWLFSVPLYLLGLNPIAVAAMLAVNLSYQFWIHTELVGRLGPLEWIFNTPSHHRVHHASNAEYLDRNFGGILIVWDRLFGTYAEEDENVSIRYGLTHSLGSLNPARLVFHAWYAMLHDAMRAPSWKARLTLLFGPPA